jgi:TPR repeat protein
MARRGTEALSGAGQPSRIIPAAQPGPTTSGPPSATGSATPVEKAEKTEKKESGHTRPAQSAKLPEASSPKQTMAARTTPRMVPAAANSTSLSLEQSGAQDLATAEGYLNGNQGKTRDSREAAQWLWKAVGKGNPGATIVLSDLYLRGDGVPKSCDQARLLLDAASRKRVKAAADRLRDLQAFGCQ